MDILEDSAYYLESYAAFVSQHNKFNNLLELTESVFVEDVVKQLNTEETNIRMLGIGSSSGRIEIPFIKQLLNRFPNIENTVVEPSADAIVAYQSSIKGKWNNVKFSWFNGTFQQYREQLESAGNDQKFHHINMVDSIYYVDNVEDDILFMYDKLEKGGIMLIVVQSDQCVMYKLKQQYPSLSPNITQLCSTSITDICKTNQIPFHLHHQESYGDITGLFSLDGLTRNEKLLLDFWTEMKDFKKQVPESLYKEVITFIKSPKCSKEIEGKLMVNTDNDMILIKKQD
ncbi:histamine N-methyltransferase A-like [Anneissia japonica]|uniref:histamine N-methyltransferase A-like n=1 Tax=Anneissia japonica TaxID=1529436 RepID=UPI001425A6C2|nr:histamine N-methyltransferase A-like [Anneissia japonica]